MKNTVGRTCDKGSKQAAVIDENFISILSQLSPLEADTKLMFDMTGVWEGGERGRS